MKQRITNKEGIIFEAPLLDREGLPFPNQPEWGEDFIVELIDDTPSYQELRAPEYPPMVEFIDALYWEKRDDSSKMQEYLNKCDVVKAKYPKG